MKPGIHSAGDKSIMHADLLRIYLPESGHLTHKDPIMGSYNNRVYKCKSLEQEQKFSALYVSFFFRMRLLFVHQKL